VPKTLYMKRIFTSIALALTAVGAHAQDSLEFNHVRALISTNGVFFHDPSTGIQDARPGYEVPKGLDAHAIFAMNLLMAGKDGNDQLHSASARYNVSDFYPGPITQNAAQYNTPAYQSRYATLWTVLKSDIDYHIAHWNTAGYVTPASLLNWPGNGDVLNGEPAIVAPFQDNNGNGLYEPANGDYPVIRGDQATLSILNDKAGIHPSGGEPIGIELHLLFYQYAGAGDLGHTTFLHTEVINRSSSQLTDFHFGAFIDFDLGASQNDYMGTSVEHNLAYVYNGSLNDPSGGGVTGYGDFPPAVGVMTLNKPLYSHVSQSTLNANSFPADAPNQEYNVLNGLYKFGAPQLDNNGDTTRYIYYGPGTTGWTAPTAFNDPPGDQKSYISFAPVTFSPYQSFCYDLGIIYAQKQGEGLFTSVDSLLLVAEKIQQFYNGEAYGCTDGFLAVETLDAISPLNIYPNPAGDHLTISGMQTGDFEITAPDGRRVRAGKFSNAEIDLQHLSAGYYVLTVYHAGATFSTKLLKE
jgi:hypothetical protein